MDATLYSIWNKIQIEAFKKISKYENANIDQIL